MPIFRRWCHSIKKKGKKSANSGNNGQKQLRVTSPMLYKSTKISTTEKRNYFLTKIFVSWQKKFQISHSLLGKGCKSKLPSFTNASALAEKLSNFFREKVCKITSKFSKFTVDCNKVSPRFTNFKAVKEESLQRALAKISASTRYHDVIPSTVFKDFSASFMPSLILLFNTSFELGVFPDDFKIAIVFPKLKNESLDPEVLSYYRPISNLIFLSKVLECLAFEQFISYFNVNLLLDDQRSAYRAIFST